MRRHHGYSTSTRVGCMAENSYASCQSLSPSTCNVEVPVASARQMGEKWENAETVLSSVPASCKPSSMPTAAVRTLQAAMWPGWTGCQSDPSQQRKKPYLCRLLSSHQPPFPQMGTREPFRLTQGSGHGLCDCSFILRVLGSVMSQMDIAIGNSAQRTETMMCCL